jgi:dipeptidyl aminopeptidase/acylaminoacyl peptidase
VNAQTPKEKLIELEKQFSPIQFISASFPPTFLIHGDKDTLVPYEQSTSFADALKKLNVSATIIIVPGAGHDPRLLVSPVASTLADWFVKTLSK